jgi:hypothetical protein
VLDEDGEYFGCLSVNDLLKSLYAREFTAVSAALLPSQKVYSSDRSAWPEARDMKSMT